MKFIPKDIDYLICGNKRQKEAYNAIDKLDIFKKLEKFNPVLAGTIPLEIDIDSSDLDIICESSDLKEFESIIKLHFGSLHSFNSYTLNVRGVPSVITSFEVHGFTFEIFCQSVTVQNQYAVIHLNIEARLLRLSDDAAKENIRNLKLQGIKTELAFAIYFKIAGDPYVELAKMANLTYQQLQNMIDELSLKH
jgi:hypothetical protein